MTMEYPQINTQSAPNIQEQQPIGHKVENPMELIILSYIIKDKKFIHRIIEFGAQPDWFTNPSLQYFYEMAVKYYTDHKEIVTKNFWSQKVAVLTKSDPQTRSYYEGFYDTIRQYDYTEHDLPAHLEAWRLAVSRHKATEEIRRYSAEVEDVGPDEALDKLVRGLTVAAGSRNRKKKWYIADLETDGAEMVLDDMEMRCDNPEFATGYKTQYASLNEYWNGFERGKVSCIYGITSSGKTTLARNIAMYMKEHYGLRVLVISCEESRLDYLKKIACSANDISLTSYLRGQLTSEEKDLIRKWVQDFRDRRKEMEADNTEDCFFRVLEVGAKEYNLHQLDALIGDQFPDGVDFVVLDQLSLLSPLKDYRDNTSVEMGDNSKAYREMAKRRNFAAILLAQAGRSAHKKNKSGEKWIDIGVEDLEGSNKVMQDMDGGIAIVRDTQVPDITKVTIVKQREGRVGITIQLIFNADKGVFLDAPNQVEDMKERAMGMPKPGSSRDKLKQQRNQLENARIGVVAMDVQGQPWTESGGIMHPVPLNQANMPQGQPVHQSAAPMPAFLSDVLEVPEVSGKMF